MSDERKFDEAAFDKAVAKPNGWSKVADPVAEIRKMRDGDEAFGKDVLRTALSLVRAHFEGADDVFLEKSRELAAMLDESGRGALASFVRAQTGDEPSWVPMERKPRAGNAAALRDALNDACHAMFEFLKKQHGGFSDMANALDKGKAALAAPARNCDRFFTAKKAMRAFDEMCEQTSSCRNDKCEVGQFRKTVGGPGCVPGWLFATMKEKGTDNG